MAISGTGTQADPYIVTTIGEVLEKVAEADAYVCLANDIYVKEDMDYREGNTVPIIINCAKFYSTNSGGNYKSIIGYRCISSATYNFNIITIGANTSVDHVGFLSFFNDRTLDSLNSSYSDIGCSNTNSSFLNCTNCNFSIFTKSSDQGQSNNSIIGGTFESCSFYFSFGARVSGSSAPFLNPTLINKSYICFNAVSSGCMLYTSYAGFFGNVTNSTINVLNNSFVNVTEGDYQQAATFLKSSCSRVILLFDLGPNLSGVTYARWARLLISGTSCAVCIIGKPDACYLALDGSGSFSATEEQLRDQTFLLGKGFV